ncbi:MAG: TraR/DksA C4-type zinc finger protein [Patescibacteria group bacterium]|jgi:DnaK suppressor protein
MEKEIVEQVKGKLLERKQQLVAQLEEMTKEKTFDKDRVQAKWEEMGDKEEDSAVEVAQYQDNISLERNLETNLEKIEIALQKIEKGKYGLCEKCGNEINAERLLANPEARHCLKCHGI